MTAEGEQEIVDDPGGHLSRVVIGNRTQVRVRHWWLQKKIDLGCSEAAWPPETLAACLLELSAKSQRRSPSVPSFDWQDMAAIVEAELYRRHKSVGLRLLSFLDRAKGQVVERVQLLMDYVEETGFLAAVECDPEIAPFSESAMSPDSSAQQRRFEAALVAIHRLSSSRRIDCTERLNQSLHNWITTLEDCVEALAKSRAPWLPIASYIGLPPVADSSGNAHGLWWSYAENGTPARWQPAKDAAPAKDCQELEWLWLIAARHAWTWALQYLDPEVVVAIWDEQYRPESALWPLSYIVSDVGGDVDRVESPEAAAIAWTRLIVQGSKVAEPKLADFPDNAAMEALRRMRGFTLGNIDDAMLAEASAVSATLLSILLDQFCGMSARFEDDKVLQIRLHCAPSRKSAKWSFSQYDGRGPQPLEPRLAALLIELSLSGSVDTFHAPSVTKLRKLIPRTKKVLVLGSKPDGSTNSVSVRDGYHLIVDYVAA